MYENKIRIIGKFLGSAGRNNRQNFEHISLIASWLIINNFYAMIT